MDIVTVLYVLAIVGIFIYQAMKKNKKNDERRPSSVDRQKEKIKLENITKQQIEPQKRKVKVKIKGDQIYRNEGKPTTVDETTHSEHHEETKNKDSNDFDLKSAVIYSTILNRKKHEH